MKESDLECLKLKFKGCELINVSHHTEMATEARLDRQTV